MRKLWGRIRRWIIRKLGGYLEPPMEPVVLRMETRRIETVCVMSHAIKSLAEKSPEYVDRVLRHGASHLGECLLEYGFVLIEPKDSTDEVLFKLSVKAQQLVDPDMFELRRLRGELTLAERETGGQ